MAYYGGNHQSNAGDGNQFYSQPAFNTTSQSSYNAQSWQPQQPQSQQYSRQQQQNQSSAYPSQQQPMGASIFTPAVAGAFGNQAVQKMMMDQGQAFVLEGIAKIVPGLEVSMITLRSYFAVDNRYVLKKIKKVLFPFMSNTWSRQVRICPLLCVQSLLDRYSHSMIILRLLPHLDQTTCWTGYTEYLRIAHLGRECT